jgi:hypothetical protein
MNFASVQSRAKSSSRFVPIVTLSDPRCGSSLRHAVGGRSRAVWRPETPANSDKIAEIDTSRFTSSLDLNAGVSISVILVAFPAAWQAVRMPDTLGAARFPTSHSCESLKVTNSDKM